MEASTDITIQIGLRLGASLAAFGAAFMLLRMRVALYRRDVLVAGAIFLCSMLIDAAALFPAGSSLAGMAALAGAAALAAGALVSLRAGLVGAVAVAAVAIVLKFFFSFVLLLGYEALVK